MPIEPVDVERVSLYKQYTTNLKKECLLVLLFFYAFSFVVKAYRKIIAITYL